MAEIAFLTGVEERIGYALRLIRKKHREGARVAVLAAPRLLLRLDHALWSEDPRSFLPHHRVRQALPHGTIRRMTRIWLLDAPCDDLACDIAINLGQNAVDWLAGHARVAEVVSTESEDQQSARQRWKAYEALGLKPDHRPHRKLSGA